MEEVRIKTLLVRELFYPWTGGGVGEQQAVEVEIIWPGPTNLPPAAPTIYATGDPFSPLVGQWKIANQQHGKPS